MPAIDGGAARPKCKPKSKQDVVASTSTPIAHRADIDLRPAFIRKEHAKSAALAKASGVRPTRALLWHR
jgi:hypothetical protein